MILQTSRKFLASFFNTIVKITAEGLSLRTDEPRCMNESGRKIGYGNRGTRSQEILVHESKN